MSIFKFRKKESKEKETKDKGVIETPKVTAGLEAAPKIASSILLKPRVAEKATEVQKNNVYIFEIHPSATKNLVRQAVRELYKVEPRKINITKNPSKRVFVRGKRGIKTGVKKAYIYLKEGDRIEIV
ncbi:MAG: large subunit ribosomal protein L23 [Parcubacteria group bacterium Gr01-1014_107]|nr:MAG: large subunit ribosomal protein L23 [Parcubacteria group bacterium Gr01-1014_107]